MPRAAKWLDWSIYNGEEALFRLVSRDKSRRIRSFFLACLDRVSFNPRSDDVAAGQRLFPQAEPFPRD